EAEAYLSVISLGETYYILFRKKGEQVAKEVTQNIMMEESLSLADAPWPRVIEAARIKAKGGLS
ncbi:MAG: type II toxin-antitoxin system VapC family toxin, partial [Bacillota bacterium]